MILSSLFVNLLNIVMLKLYHEPMSFNSRRVWITLIEKNLDFELEEVNLDGEQFKPEFLALNPFHHIPVLVDDGFNLIESLAMLDYLEARYPNPQMLPTEAKDRAIVKMVEMVTVNELASAFMTISPEVLGIAGGDPEKMKSAKQKITLVLEFFENLLDDRPFFGSENITLAEPVAGTIVPWLARTDIGLNNYPKLNAWCDLLTSRSSWQTTDIKPEMMEKLKSQILQYNQLNNQ
jgi:glutathione S-transferase